MIFFVNGFLWVQTDNEAIGRTKHFNSRPDQCNRITGARRLYGISCSAALIRDFCATRRIRFFVSDLFQKRPSWRGAAVAGPFCLQKKKYHPHIIRAAAGWRPVYLRCVKRSLARIARCMKDHHRSVSKPSRGPPLPRRASILNVSRLSLPISSDARNSITRIRRLRVRRHLLQFYTTLARILTMKLSR